jgi:hypothetical protein
MALRSASFRARAADPARSASSALASAPEAVSEGRWMKRWLRGARAAHPPDSETASRHEVARRQLTTREPTLVTRISLKVRLFFEIGRTYSSLLKRLLRFIKYSTKTTSVRAVKIAVVVLMNPPSRLRVARITTHPIYA